MQGEKSFPLISLLFFFHRNVEKVKLAVRYSLSQRLVTELSQSMMRHVESVQWFELHGAVLAEI